MLYVYYLLDQELYNILLYNIILLNFYLKTEAVKKMKKFSKFDTIDVENSLRIFIAGAKFRDSSRKNQNPSALAHT